MIKYANANEERIKNRIEKLQKQSRLLRAGAVEAVINQNYVEISLLQAMLDELQQEGGDTE